MAPEAGRTTHVCAILQTTVDAPTLAAGTDGVGAAFATAKACSELLAQLCGARVTP